VSEQALQQLAQALRLYGIWCLGKRPKRGFIVITEIFLSERRERLHHG
jgi:hypothetical protein